MITTAQIPFGQEGRSSCTIFGSNNHSDLPLVICLHGFPDDNGTFYLQVPALVDAGYRVACPMLPGYEPSSINQRGHYDVNTVANDIIAIIQAIKAHLSIPASQRVHLIGHDWGSISGFATVCKAPELFYSYSSLTIPYGLSLEGILKSAKSYIPYSWYIQLFQLRKIAEHVIKRKQGRFIHQLIDRWSEDWQMPEKRKTEVVRTLSKPKALEGALGYYRAIYGLSKRERLARKLLTSKIHVPTLCLQAKRDQCIHSSLWKLNHNSYYTSTLQMSQVYAGHFPHQEAPEAVNSLLIKWLNQQTR